MHPILPPICMSSKVLHPLLYKFAQDLALQAVNLIFFLALFPTSILRLKSAARSVITLTSAFSAANNALNTDEFRGEATSVTRPTVPDPFHPASTDARFVLWYSSNKVVFVLLYVIGHWLK